jgi:hypothetical protein
MLTSPAVMAVRPLLSRDSAFLLVNGRSLLIVIGICLFFIVLRFTCMLDLAD